MMKKFGYLYLKRRNASFLQESVRKVIKYIVATAVFITIVPLLGEYIRVGL